MRRSVLLHFCQRQKDGQPEGDRSSNQRNGAGEKDFGIEYGVIVCAMRHHSTEDNMRMIKTAREYLGSGVCAADLAGAEALYPMSEFMDIFTETKKMGMPFTLHAGECGNPQNVIDSINVGAGRIGHGIAMRGNQEIRKMAKSRYWYRDVSDQQFTDQICKQHGGISDAGISGCRLKSIGQHR